MRRLTYPILCMRCGATSHELEFLAEHANCTRPRPRHG